jgi:hypothetical protein
MTIGGVLVACRPAIKSALATTGPGMAPADATRLRRCPMSHSDFNARLLHGTELNRTTQPNPQRKLEMQVLKKSIVACTFACVGLASPAHGKVFSVGADASCSYHSVDEALDAARTRPGRDEVRLARNALHTLHDAPPPDPQLQLVGGYSSCSAAQASGYTRLVLESDDARQWLSHLHDRGGVRTTPVIEPELAPSSMQR